VLVAHDARRELEPGDPERLDSQLATDETNGSAGTGRLHLVDVKHRPHL